MRNPAFRRGDLTTNFIEEENILEAVENVVKADSEKGATLASALEAKDKKVAAITAAVHAYVNMAKNTQQ
jgi:pyruvate carboxylase subunit A